MVTEWKRTSEKDREEFRAWADEWIRHRMRRAHEQYGEEYQGNPLETVVGEMFDALFASWLMSRNGAIGDQVGPWDHPDSVQFYAHHRHSYEELYPSEKVFFEQSVHKAMTMLDVGCASGGLYRIASSISPDIRYTGVDISAPSISEATRSYPGAKFEVGSGTDLGRFGDIQFDLVTCFNVAVHEPQIEDLLRECYRVAYREVLFDVRLGLECHQGQLRIAFSGEDTGKRTPYLVHAYNHFFNMLDNLVPRPAAIEMAGYKRPVSHMAEGVPQEVFMAIFKLVKHEG